MAMSNSVIHIDVATQQLFLTGVITRTYSISTALNGVGEQEGSGCTPRGQHIIANKIGADHAMNSVFVGRIFTGEIYHPELAALYPQSKNS
jgi:L,D-transpeptidase YbiS